MIEFKCLDKNDLNVLFEGFETSFFQAPFKSKAKTIMRYVPKGFRTDKLKRHQLIKVFVDAIEDGEINTRKFVSDEIEHNFSETGIDSFISTNINNKEYLSGLGLLELSSLIWKNHLRIPAYLVYRLYGIDCPEEIKSASLGIHKAFYEEIDKYGEFRFEEGCQIGEKKNSKAIDEEKKHAAKLEKSIALLKQQKDDINLKLTELNKEYDDTISLINTYSEELSEYKNNISQLEKEKIQLANECKKTEEKLLEKNKLEKQLNIIREENKNKEQLIEDLQADLSKALAMAYSDIVVERLSDEVLDELTAMSLRNTEILEIAKQRFSEEETILEGWKKLSSESNELIELIINDFNSCVFSEKQLDLLETIEDGILIRYTVTKSLKAILFNELEKKEVEATIGERFGGKN